MMDYKDVGSLDFDDFENDDLSLNENDKIVSEFKCNAKSLAKQYVEQFFKDKSLHIGGKIPNKFLHNEKRISMILNYTVCDGIDHSIKALAMTYPEMANDINQKVSRDSELIKEVLVDIGNARIPKEFAGGILCVYLELIEGVDF